MRLAIHFRPQLRKIGMALVNELEEAYEIIRTWASAEHNDDGGHTNVTAETVTVSGEVTLAGAITSTAGGDFAGALEGLSVTANDEFFAGDGAAGAPSYTFTNNSDIGAYLNDPQGASEEFRFEFNGDNYFRADGDGMQFEAPVTFNAAATATLQGITQFVGRRGDGPAVSPAQITGNQNNYAPTGLDTTNWLRINSDAARDITGLDASSFSDGQDLIVTNVGAFDIRLMHESASSTDVNRFHGNNLTNITLQPRDSAKLRYDGTLTRWLNISL